MGLSCSRLGSNRPSRVGSRRPNTTKRTISSIFLCGASSSKAVIHEMEDDHDELVLKSGEDNKLVARKARSPRNEPDEITATSEINVITSEDLSSEDTSDSIQTNDKRKSVSENVLVPPHRSSIDSTSSNRASTSYENRASFDPNSSNTMVNNFIDNTENIVDKDLFETCFEVTHSSSQSSLFIENHDNEVSAVNNNFDSGSSSFVSASLSTSNSMREETLQESIGSDGSISSNNLSSGSADISARESRRNSRRLFWDAFARRNSRRHTDSRTLVFSGDDADEVRSHDRWLLDFGSDFLEDGARNDSRYLGSRIHGINERRRHSRSEIWERLRGGLDGVDRRNDICPSGLHPNGTCSCESSSITEDSGPHASISRIVMLAEALFEVLPPSNGSNDDTETRHLFWDRGSNIMSEYLLFNGTDSAAHIELKSFEFMVLDEIHRQPVSLSLSVVSVPAPESVVDALPVKNHKNTHKIGSDAEQCQICLLEYEEGDKIRVLPCHHEYHMSCVDKWLKEIHGVCPLCRGDVCQSSVEASVSA